MEHGSKGIEEKVQRHIQNADKHLRWRVWKGWKLLTIFTEHFILDVSQGPGYVSELPVQNQRMIRVHFYVYSIALSGCLKYALHIISSMICHFLFVKLNKQLTAMFFTQNFIVANNFLLKSGSHLPFFLFALMIALQK